MLTEFVTTLDNNDEATRMAGTLAWPIVEDTHNVTTSSGRIVQIRVYYPPELRKEEVTSFPLVVHVYSGPGSQLVLDKWKLDFNHVMSSGKSFIVMEVDGAGSGGQGEARKTEIKYKLGQLEVLDQLDAIQ